MTKLIKTLAALSLLVSATGGVNAITLQSADGPVEFGPAPQAIAQTYGTPKVSAAARGAFAMQPGTVRSGADTSREALVMTSQ